MAMVNNDITTAFYVDEHDTLWCSTRSGLPQYIAQRAPGCRAKDFKRAPLQQQDAFFYQLGKEAYLHGFVSGKKDKSIFSIPLMLIQPFIENAIHYGIFTKLGTDGKIALSFMREKSQLQCTIDDNGIGREQAEALMRKWNRQHRSFGLSVTEERLQVLNLQHQGISRIVIEDKTDVNGCSMGTRVSLRIPFYEGQKKKGNNFFVKRC